MNSSDYSRRRFLKVPAAAAALSGAPAILSAQTSSNTIRVAFIGVGNRGSYLLRHMMKVPNVQIVAIADIDTATLQKVLSQVKDAGGQAPATYTDYRKMLDERKEIDAVVIATPVDSHKDITISALEVGKNVYTEKPMAASPEECRMMLKAAKSAKGIFQAGFQLRHDPNRRASMNFIHSGGIGKVLYLHGMRHGGDLPRNTLWYFDRSRSGDNIVEQACHILDLFTWAIGKEPLRAMGTGGINLFHDIPPGRTTMDNYSVIYDFPGDIRVNFSHIYFDPPGFTGIKERVWGSNGAIDLALATWYEREKKSENKLDVPDAGQSPDYLSLAAFIENARGKKTPVNNVESAYRSTLVAILGRKAIYEKRVVNWSEVAG